MKYSEFAYEMFMTGVSTTDIVSSIYNRTVFARGLPEPVADLRGKPNITDLSKEVITNECIVLPGKYLASDPRDRRPSARYSVLVGFIPKSEQMSMECCTHLHPHSTGDVLTGWLTDRHWTPGSPSRTCWNFP